MTSRADKLEFVAQNKGPLLRRRITSNEATRHPISFGNREDSVPESNVPTRSPWPRSLTLERWGPEFNKI